MFFNAFRERGRGDVLRRNKLVKWEFYSAVVEYLLAYVDDYETNTCSADIPKSVTSHKTLASTRAFGKIYPSCAIFYLEECFGQNNR